MGKKIFICVISVVILLASCTNQETANIKPTNSKSPIKEPERTESIVTPKPKMSFSGEELHVQYIRTDGYHANSTYPKTITIKSMQELHDYYEHNKNIYNFKYDSVYQGTDKDFHSVVEQYNEQYFKDNSLLLVLVQEGSGSYQHDVTSIVDKDDILDINIDTLTPEVFTDDMAEWHIIIELPQSILNVQDCNVVINRMPLQR